MATSTHSTSTRTAGSTGRQGRLPKYKRNYRTAWTREEIQMLREFARHNTPTRVIGLKLGRTENAVRAKASGLGISLWPPNRSPYGRVH